MTDYKFKFKDLLVWQESIDFADKIIETTENLETNRKHFRLVEQMESCGASIPGKGRYSK